jgi:hypothetical protein
MRKHQLCAVLLVALNLSDASCTRDMKATMRLDHPANMCAGRTAFDAAVAHQPEGTWMGES